MLSFSSVKRSNLELGFSLIEMLVAMAISSVICIAVMSTIPTLFKQIYQSYFQYQIDKDVKQVLINMEKDFRRIGYCSSLSCQGKAIRIESKLLSRYPNSCIIFAYDQDLSGKWINRKSKKIDSDFFGYRLNGNKLESNRNVNDCNGTRWQSLFDAKLITVNQLQFHWNEANALLEMIISVETKLLPKKIFTYRTAVMIRNLQ
ncbi:prepilin peptidase-dependent protein [Providencia sp. Je.9.19]|uniref:prepilin peptidase-dependent protein n=1 Tax=unclassified Providencia TaxID=2633465 RepID=UPI003DA98D16